MIDRPVVIIGAGGHTKVLIDTLRRQSAEIIGVTDVDPKKIGSSILGVPILGDDTIIDNYQRESIFLVNGLGMVDNTNLRKQVFESFKRRGYSFTSVIHDSAVIASGVKLCEGVQILAGAVIQAACIVGSNSIINTRASLDHDTQVGSHVHIAPGVTISGGVKIDDGTLVGAGATVIQGVTIGSSCLIAAGSVVINDVPNNTKVIGVPARREKNE
jgi:sugar O-acyltransferase (sialic acid O-acetyltransferase NeuD family)